MKFKKIFKTAVVGLSLFAFAGTVAAEITADVNVYGASAQFIMWRDNADDFMTSQSCTGVQNAQLCKKSGTPATCVSPFEADGKNAITKGICGNDPAPNYFRTTAKASYAGVLSIQGNTTHPYRITECTNPNEVKMIDESTCNFTTGQCTGTKCVPVTVGASDVPVECFTQTSEGALNGPAGGTNTVRNFLENPITWTGSAPCKPLVVPFAFFVNNDAKKGGATITNITKDHAEIIFNGQAYDWSDLVDADGVAFDARALTACLRHAGSGTQASADAYLTSPLVGQEETGHIYFNDGSSQEMSCVNTVSGAIGYADADQSLTSYTNTSRLSLNGVTVNAGAIAGGNYNFYGMQQLYGVEAGSDLCNFAGNPDYITNPLWVAGCKMVYERGNSCESFPLTYIGATCP